MTAPHPAILPSSCCNAHSPGASASGKYETGPSPAIRRMPRPLLPVPSSPMPVQAGNAQCSMRRGHETTAVASCRSVRAVKPSRATTHTAQRTFPKAAATMEIHVRPLGPLQLSLSVHTCSPFVLCARFPYEAKTFLLCGSISSSAVLLSSSGPWERALAASAQ